MPAPVWIAWETQRRSLTLSSRLGCRLRLFDAGGREALRYPLSALRTLRLLLSERPSLVIVQNPSMILAALACACKPLLGFALVVDRHSNFLLSGPAKGWRAALFTALSRYTLKKADLTVVTNGEIADKVIEASGRPFILPDPYPDLQPAPLPPRRPVPEMVFVCSWAADEPIREMMKACAALRTELVMRVTGRPKPVHAALLRERPDNFRPTGFLPDPDYFRLLAEADALAVLTTLPSTLVCGAYEGIALGKPLLLSGSRVLREYFAAGAVHLDSHRPEEMVRKIRMLIARRFELREEALAFRERSGSAWAYRCAELRGRLADLAAARGKAVAAPPGAVPQV